MVSPWRYRKAGVHTFRIKEQDINLEGKGREDDDHQKKWIYVGGVAGGDSNHQHPGGNSAAGFVPRAGSGAAAQLPKQSEAVGLYLQDVCRRVRGA